MAYKIFVCEESNSRVGLGVELENGCVAGAIDEPFIQMVQQLQMAIRSDDIEEIITAIEEAPVLNREQFMEVVNKCRMLAEISCKIDEIPTLPMVERDTPISYEEMEDLFIELNPEIVALFDQINNGKIEAPEVETVEVEAEDGLVQVIEREIENLQPDDNVEDNPILFQLIQDQDTYHMNEMGFDRETNLDIEKEESKSLFRKLVDKLMNR